MPGTEEVLFNGGLYHDSCSDETRRGAELREQRKRLSGGGHGGREPPRTDGSESPRPSGSTEPCSVHFIHWSGICPHGLGTAREAALPEHSTRGTFPMPSVYPQVPAQGLLRDF